MPNTRPKAPVSYALLRRLNQQRCLALWSRGFPRERIAACLGTTLAAVCALLPESARNGRIFIVDSHEPRGRRKAD